MCVEIRWPSVSHVIVPFNTLVHTRALPTLILVCLILHMAAGINFIPQILCFISEKIYVLIPVSQGIFIKSLSIRQRY